MSNSATEVYQHLSPLTALKAEVIGIQCRDRANFAQDCLEQFMELSDPMDSNAFFDACVKVGLLYNIDLRRALVSIPISNGFVSVYRYQAEPRE